MDYNKCVKDNILTIPDGKTNANCWSCKLVNIVIPDSVTVIGCWDNNIKELNLNNKLLNLGCDIFVNLNNINNKYLTINFWYYG